MTDVVAVLCLGFLLGMRHATESDHVVAVSTIVSTHRSLPRAAFVGAMWGIGHTFTIALLGGLIIVFNLVVPEVLGLSMEFCVALMLVVLGVANLSGAVRRIDAVAHSHAGPAHTHTRVPGLGRPLVVGVVHGLAGSAAITVLVLETIHDPRFALLYLLLFGVGTICGMVLLTLLLALPLTFAASKWKGAGLYIVRTTSLLSIGLGLFLAYKIGVVDGLFVGTPHWTPE